MYTNGKKDNMKIIKLALWGRDIEDQPEWSSEELSMGQSKNFTLFPRLPMPCPLLFHKVTAFGVCTILAVQPFSSW